MLLLLLNIHLNSIRFLEYHTRLHYTTRTRSLQHSFCYWGSNATPLFWIEQLGMEVKNGLRDLAYKTSIQQRHTQCQEDFPRRNSKVTVIRNGLYWSCNSRGAGYSDARVGSIVVMPTAENLTLMTLNWVFETWWSECYKLCPYLSSLKK